MSIRLSRLSLVLLVVVVLSIIVLAIGTNDVSLTTPTNKTYFNGNGNYSTGYVFTWEDTGDTSYGSATCTLYMNTTDSGLPGHDGYYQANVPNTTSQTFYQNASFGAVGIWYWTIECCNTSSSPNCWSPASQAVIYDNTTPTVNVMSVGFTNNTLTTNNTVSIFVNVTDADYTGADTYNCTYLNVTDGAEEMVGTTMANHTKTELTYTIEDGTNTIRIRCRDQVPNEANSTNDYVLIVDATDPVIAYDSTFTPADGSNVSSGANILINFSVTEQNFDTAYVNFDGTLHYTNSTNNCTGTAPNYLCQINISQSGTVSQKFGILFNVSINDTAGTLVTTDTRNFTIDTAAPTENIVQNFSVTDTVLSWNFTVNDVLLQNCGYQVYNRTNGLEVSSTGEQITRISATVQQCNGILNQSAIRAEGNFTVNFTATDYQGNVMGYNMTGILTNLKTGWNLVSWTSTNNTVQFICETMQYCTQVAKYSNTAGSFTTYSTSTPTVNNNTDIVAGEAIAVYVSADDYIIANDYLPADNTLAANVTVRDTWWNAIGLIYDADMDEILNLTELEGSTANISDASWINTSSGQYHTCKASFGICSATAVLPASIPLIRGYAVWVLSGANATINRTDLRN